MNIYKINQEIESLISKYEPVKPRGDEGDLKRMQDLFSQIRSSEDVRLLGDCKVFLESRRKDILNADPRLLSVFIQTLGVVCQKQDPFIENILKLKKQITDIAGSSLFHFLGLRANQLARNINKIEYAISNSNLSEHRFIQEIQKIESFLISLPGKEQIFYRNCCKEAIDALDLMISQALNRIICTRADIRCFDEEGKPIPLKTANTIAGSGGILTIRGAKIRFKGLFIAESGNSKKITGAGGFGRVYKSEVGQFAIKVAFLNDETPINDLITEAELLIRTGGCSYVVGARDAVVFEDRMIALMDYLEGGTFEERASDKKNPISRLQAIMYLTHAAKGIKELHDLNIMHADLKFSNMVIDSKTDTLKLVDLGFAAIGDSYRYRGTLDFMAPEIIKLAIAGRGPTKHTKSIDIYSFGIILHKLFTGKILGKQQSKNGIKIFNDRFENLVVSDREYRLVGFTPNQSASLAYIVNNCLKVDPEERLTASQLVRRMENLLSMV